jgi:hypothetical protein
VEAQTKTHVHHHRKSTRCTRSPPPTHIPSFCRPSTRIPFHHLLLSIFLPLDTSPNHIRCINFHLSATYSYSVHHHLLLSIFLPLDTSPKHPLPLLPLPFALSIYLSAVGRKRKSKPSVACFKKKTVAFPSLLPFVGSRENPAQECFYVSLRNGLSITMAVQHIYWSSHYYRWEDYTQFLCVTGY